MQRIAIGLEYLGTAFAGWQQQGHADTVQGRVEGALSAVADAPVAVTAAGRTDAGVHATGQVAHFDSSAVRTPRAWLLGANSHLPPGINLTWARPVPGEFHARHAALSRSYEYLILNREVRSACLHERAWWVHGALDHEAMHEAASSLLGEHDFSAFRAAECQSRTARREIREIAVTRHGDLVVVRCRANAFLHHMVRNIVGSLVRVGRGDEPVSWLREVLEGRDRRVAGMTAPPGGLCLVRVEYPASFDLPEPPSLRRDL